MAAPLKVMLMCERLDLAGGVERFACTLANHLAGQGMQVSLASTSTPRERVHYPLRPQVQVLHGAAKPDARLPVRGLVRRLALVRKQWQVGLTLKRLARVAQPDVLILNGLTTACSLLALAPDGRRARSAATTTTSAPAPSPGSGCGGGCIGGSVPSSA